jgi:acetate kinase
MDVLVINSGSSSIKADVLDADTGVRRISVRIERIGTAEVFARWDGGERELIGDVDQSVDHSGALTAVLPRLCAAAIAGSITTVGHRVVHGGELYVAPTALDDHVVDGLRALIPLAPLHNPANLAGIDAARALLPDAVHVAVFDTGFHATLPPAAKTYALPVEVSERHGLRRYGFHGTSHQWVAQRAADWLISDLRDLRVVTCHLGNGASLCAVEYGSSVDTTMGMTPLEGLVMGTRSGDVDPGVLIALLRSGQYDVDALETMLNRASGLKGLSGVSQDMRDIEARAAAGDERCQLAIDVYVHRVVRMLGGMVAVMGGVDAIVFCGGIGENSTTIRRAICARLAAFGAKVDGDANLAAKVTLAEPVARISSDRSRVAILAIATDEEHAIARASMVVSRALSPVAANLTIPIAVSARHIHLTRDAIDTLFGPGHQLTPRKPLSQPGQFACEETLTVVGPRRSIEGVRVLGPERRACQIEVSRTDEFHLGLDAPVRASGNVAGSVGARLIGPAGELVIKEGVICAWRHIHMTPADAARFGVADKDVVDVAIDSDGRNLVFGDVLVRVSDRFTLEMHIDTDEANAAEISSGDAGALVSVAAYARLVRSAPTAGGGGER